MTGRSRRTVLGAMAVAVASPRVLAAAQADDAELLERVKRFYECYARSEALWEKRQPHFVWEEANQATNVTGAAVREVFELRAHTLKGALQQLKIVFIALGPVPNEGDDTVECFQDYDDPWFPRVIADLENAS